jgi:HK97 gp10 family phage protein
MANGTFNIRIEGLEELIAGAKQAGGSLPGKLERAMVTSTTLVAEDARRTGPDRFKNQTGNLRRSIFRRVDGPHRGVIGVGEKYGAYVEFGTRPHVITPKKGKFLAFKSKSGKVVYAKRINHPGSRPYPFMQPAMENNQGRIVQIYDQVSREVVAAMAG